MKNSINNAKETIGNLQAKLQNQNKISQELINKIPDLTQRKKMQILFNRAKKGEINAEQFLKEVYGN